MKKSLILSTPNDLEAVIERVFDAPQALVFRCYTEPQLVRRWMTGPPGWIFEVCEIDLRVGGTYRYVWLNTDGNRMGMRGVFREIAAPKKLVDNQLFDDDPGVGETISTVSFAAQENRTLVTTTLKYASKQARDAALKTGMAEGMEMSFHSLEDLINTIKPQNTPKTQENK